MEKKTFEQLDDISQERIMLLPRLVRVTKNPDDETYEQAFYVADKIHRLPKEIRMKLIAPEVFTAMQFIREQFKFTNLQMSDIARAIRSYYFKEITLADFPVVLQKEMEVGASLSDRITRLVVERVINLKLDFEEDVVATVQFILLKALEKYPRINEQQLTGERIRVKSERDTVRGTVRNWLRAYRDVLGVRTHTAIERGQFLFQSENAKRLPSDERDKVSVLLKALDENTLLAIDPDRQEIVFPEKHNEVNRSQQQTDVELQQSPVAYSRMTFQQPEPVPSAPVRNTISRPASFAHNFASPAPSLKQEEFSAKQVPAPSNLPIYARAKAEMQKTEKQRTGPEQVPQHNDSEEKDDSFSFSSGHMLPSEKEALVRMDNQPVPQPQQQPRPQQLIQSQQKLVQKRVYGPDYSINGPKKVAKPVASQNPKEVWQIPSTLKNVVDLRSEE